MVVVGDFRDIIEKKYYDKYLGYSISNFVDDNAAEATWCPTADVKFKISVFFRRFIFSLLV